MGWVDGQRALVLGMAGRMAESAGSSRVARALSWPRGQCWCPSLWQLHSRGGGLRRVHTQGGWIAASHPSKRAGCGDARASGSRSVQQRPTARGHVSEAVSRGTPVSRCCGGSQLRMSAGWCWLGKVGVVGRRTDECRRSTGPSTLTRCPRRGRSGIAWAGGGKC